MGIKTLFAFTVLTASSFAIAADIPRFDVEASCEEVSGGSHDMFNFCIEEEQAAYNQLRDAADSIDPQTIDYCTDVAGDSYDMLLFCIEEETEAADNRQSFSFD